MSARPLLVRPRLLWRAPSGSRTASLSSQGGAGFQAAACDTGLASSGRKHTGTTGWRLGCDQRGSWGATAISLRYFTELSPQLKGHESKPSRYVLVYFVCRSQVLSDASKPAINLWSCHFHFINEEAQKRWLVSKFGNLPGLSQSRIWQFIWALSKERELQRWENGFQRKMTSIARWPMAVRCRESWSQN